jgi:hypothetical protein
MDERKNNGGNSTVAKGFDKRKNPYKEILEKALKPDKLALVIKMLYNKSINEQDVNASKILLEYYLGKPTQSVINENINYNEESLTPERIEEIKKQITNAYQ